MVTPFLVDRVLERWASEKLIKVVETGACVAALVSLMLFAVIRGDLLTQEVGNASPAVVFNTDSPVAPQAENSFYQETLWLLRVIMALLALAIELGAGSAVREARRWSAEGEEVAALRAEQAEVRQEMIACVEELELKETEGTRFEDAFQRDYSRTRLNGHKPGAQRFSVLLLGLLALGHLRASAADHLNLVVAVDLTASVSAVGPDDKRSQ